MPIDLRRLLGAALIAAACATPAAAQAPQGPWLTLSPFPVPSEEVLGAAANGKMYVFAGFKLPESGPAAWDPIDNAWEYDPAADTWKALAPLPTRRGAASAAVLNGK